MVIHTVCTSKGSKLTLKRKKESKLDIPSLKHSISSCHSTYWKCFPFVFKGHEEQQSDPSKSDGIAIVDRKKITHQFIVSIIMSSNAFKIF